jgi:hypothetical protein
MKTSKKEEGVTRQEALQVNGRNAQHLGKAFWMLAKHYNFSREEQAVLLGIKLNRQRLLDLEKAEKIPEEPDKFARVGNLLGIHKSLRILYPYNRSVVYGWMKIPHPLFNGLSAMDYIKSGNNSFERLFAVRRKLDQVRVS